MNWKYIVALVLQAIGVQPSYSTNIAGGLTCGYGQLDPNGFWEYPVFNHQEVRETT